MFSEVPNPKTPKLHQPDFVVHYKRKDIAPPFPSMHSYMVFLGASCSGKASLLLSTLNHRKLFKKAFHTIFVSFTSVSEESSIFLDLPEDQVCNELDHNTQEEIYNKILHLSSEKYDSLIVLDDMTSELKNPQLLRIFNTVIHNRRHLQTSVFTVVQIYNSIPLSNRKTINYLIMYKKNKQK